KGRGWVSGAGRMAARRFQPSVLPDRHARDSEKRAEYRHFGTYMVVWGQGGILVGLARPDAPGDTRTNKSVITRRAGNNENVELLLSRWARGGQESWRVYNGIYNAGSHLGLFTRAG